MGLKKQHNQIPPQAQTNKKTIKPTLGNASFGQESSQHYYTTDKGRVLKP